jgi:hypothetical protein
MEEAMPNLGYYPSIPSSRMSHLIAVRRFVCNKDSDNYASGSVATGRASHPGQVINRCQGARRATLVLQVGGCGEGL